jgi:hypothetical protein
MSKRQNSTYSGNRHQHDLEIFAITKTQLLTGDDELAVLTVADED